MFRFVDKVLLKGCDERDHFSGQTTRSCRECAGLRGGGDLGDDVEFEGRDALWKEGFEKRVKGGYMYESTPQSVQV